MYFCNLKDMKIVARSSTVTVTKVKFEKKEFQDVIKYLKEFQEIGLKGNQRASLDRGTPKFENLEALIRSLETIAPDDTTSSYVIERIVSQDSIVSNEQPEEQESVYEKRGLLSL